MTQRRRLQSGGRIDRNREIEFRWNGRTLRGHPGDTLASALLANGVHFVGRSFKYHRPRGILGAGAEEPNALVTIKSGPGREDPNTRATQTVLRPGLAVFSQNAWPSLRFDLGALNGGFGSLWSAGFYYKTFMWPRSAWRAVYEPLIRRAAGLGSAPSGPDPDHYSARYAHCDVLVVGAGPAGIAAAQASADAGARVILCDEQGELGGSVLSSAMERIGGEPAAQWLRRSVDNLATCTTVTLLPATTAFGYYADNMLGLVQDLGERGDSGLPRQRLWQVRAAAVVLATGAIERPLVFPDNDRPGILLASAARTYLNRYAVLVGDRIAVYAANDDGYASALDIQSRCGCVKVIVDPRDRADHPIVVAARNAGIEVLTSHAVAGTRGRQHVSAIHVASLDPTGNVSERARTIACDSLLMAGGWTPTVHLFSQTRSPLEWNDAIQAFVPGKAKQRTWVAGACRGLGSLSESIADGEHAGRGAARSVRDGNAKTGDSNSTGTSAPRIAAVEPAAYLSSLDKVALRPKSFVDFQNDVCASDIAQAVQEGFHSVEHLKRYTTTGMATDQGKTSNLNALGQAARLLDKAPPHVGTTTFRPPYTPVTFGALAGEHRGLQADPVRKTPIHGWAAERGALFEPVGLWQRARYFPQAGESLREAVARECRQTRRGAGIFDASTLGKIEVVGPDAAEFLQRMYTNAWSGLAVGRCRYGLLLREDGYVFDDGVVGRLAADRFHVTTTTGGAPRVLQHMEDYLQTEFRDLRVWLTSTTEEWAVIAVNGPMARSLLQPLVEDIDLAPAAFPHMAVRAGRVCAVPARVFRVSFTGELGFEINVPATSALHVWQEIQRSGTRYGAATYGTESMHVMRAEKGYVIIGQDTDGTVTPADLGLEWAIGKGKPDFVGQRSLERADLRKSGRKQLVGLLTTDGATLLEEGAQIVRLNDQGSALASEGHVTSAYFSATLGHPIALALIADGRHRVGATVRVSTAREPVEARIVAPVFYDPKGERLHV